MGGETCRCLEEYKKMSSRHFDMNDPCVCGHAYAKHYPTGKYGLWAISSKRKQISDKWDCQTCEWQALRTPKPGSKTVYAKGYEWAHPFTLDNFAFIALVTKSKRC